VVVSGGSIRQSGLLVSGANEGSTDAGCPSVASAPRAFEAVIAALLSESATSAFENPLVDLASLNTTRSRTRRDFPSNVLSTVHGRVRYHLKPITPLTFDVPMRASTPGSSRA